MNIQRYTLGYIFIPILGILLYSHNLMGYKIKIQNASSFPIAVRVAYHGESVGLLGNCHSLCPDFIDIPANKDFDLLTYNEISNIEVWDQTRKKSFGWINMEQKKAYDVIFDDWNNPPLRKK